MSTEAHTWGVGEEMAARVAAEEPRVVLEAARAVRDGMGAGHGRVSG